MPPKKKRKRTRSSSPNRVVLPPEDLIDESRRKEILLCFKTALESYNNENDETSNEFLPNSFLKKPLKKLKLSGLKLDGIKSYFDDENLEALDADMFLRFAADKSIQMEKSNRAFQLIDNAGKGVVVLEDLQRACSVLGEDMTENELIEMIDFADSSGEGLLYPKHMFRIANKVNL
ncbi:unnamed protein product [Pseudo-nitzschia multistriata]|uniref:EF-hand domain-containing protein n=1 Tax=Pseudo-nitzschia multistriata TaxID=183589 RepID=A0A448ZLS2_9STRA|nr:unnamed protein product [Pseudo-nitzschia multistriata]